MGAVEDADVVQPEEAAAEDVAAVKVLAVDPPGEVQQELLKGPLEEEDVAFAFFVSDLVDAPHRPCVHGRVHI